MRLAPILVVALPVAALAGPVTKAQANLSPTKDSKVAGEVSFTKVEGGVKVVAHLTGLQAGNHGFHIHEFGDCSAPDGSTAGGHFNPAAHKHGGPKDAEADLDLPVWAGHVPLAVRPQRPLRDDRLTGTDAPPAYATGYTRPGWTD